MEKELYHYGVMGMKWGVRRYRNEDGSLTTAGKKRQGRQYAKELNSLDKKQTAALSNVIRSDMKYMKRSASANRYIDKHNNNPSQRNVNTIRKKKEKMFAAADKRDEYAQKYKQLDSESWNKIIEFAKSGYTINSKEVVRQTKKGEQYASYVLSGVIGHTTVNSIQMATYGDRWQTTFKNGQSFNQTPWMVKGYKYKVTPNKNDDK